jgi:transglycosylase SLT domain protein
LKRLLKFLITLLILASIIFILFKVVKIDDIIMKKLYPLKYSEYVEKYAKEYNIDKYMVYAIIKAESNFNENAKSSSDAIGLMQIMEITAIETARKMDLEVTEEDLFKPDLNINIGLKYFTYLLNQYDNNYPLAIIAYNAGMGNVDAWIKDGTIKEDGTDIENVPFKETNNYVRKILRDYEIYKGLYN